MKRNPEIQAAWQSILTSASEADQDKRARLYDLMNLAASREDEKITATDFSKSKLKKLYHRCAQALHPDHYAWPGENSSSPAVALNEVFAFLSDDDKRRQLDAGDDAQLSHPFADDYRQFRARSNAVPLSSVSDDAISAAELAAFRMARQRNTDFSAMHHRNGFLNMAALASQAAVAFLGAAVATKSNPSKGLLGLFAATTAVSALLSYLDAEDKAAAQADFEAYQQYPYM